jgi:light-regulated signal transduction histidine kinase (bacteriophytochrome)
VEINGAIRDVLELTRDEVTKNGVSVLTHFAEPSPTVQADRVQLQQVILNLIINAVEAMSRMREEARVLLICTEKEESNGALVAVRDSTFSTQSTQTGAAGRTPPRRKIKSADRTANPQSVAVRLDTRLAPLAAAVSGTIQQ